MSEKVTPQEALNVIGGMENMFRKGEPVEASNMVLVALMLANNAIRASIPHVLTLAEAGSLEPHTAVWVEFRIHGTMDGPYAVGSILRKGDWSCYMHTVRWWNLWPSEELRAATPWLDDDSSK